jgi:hypothetical protein
MMGRGSGGFLGRDTGARKPSSLIEYFSNGTFTTYEPVSTLASAVPLGIGWWLRRRRRAA